MKIINHNLVSFYAVCFSLFITQLTHAEETITNALQSNTMTEKSINRGDFIFDIQKTDPAILARDVEKMRGFYLRRQHELSQRVANKKLDAGDVIITVIMPGGLLYAGFRQQEFEQAKSDLQIVAAELSELSIDLQALQGQDAAHPLLLAQLP